MPHGKIIKSVFIITVSYIFSLLLSLVIQVILAGHFGAGAEIDSYFVAFTIPSFFILILNTSISKVFIPLFIDCKLKENENSAWRLANNFLNTAFVSLLFLLMIGELSAPHCIRWLAPGLNSHSYCLAVSLIRILLPVIVFSGISTLLNSLYYADNKFLRPSAALILNNLIVCLFVIFLKKNSGIYSIAYGILTGAAIQSLFLSPVLFKKYSIVMDIKDRNLKKLLKLILPVMIGAVFYKGTVLIEKNIASHISVGSISYLGYAYRIIPILLALTTTGISTTFFPLLSKFATLNDWKKTKKTFLLGINSLMIIIAPLVMYMIILRVPIIQLLYQRGQFTYSDTLATADILFYYLIALFFMVISTLPSQIYVVTKSTKILIPIGIFEIIAYTGYCIWLASLFRLRGIAMAFALYYMIAFLINYAILYRRIKRFSFRDIFITPGKILSAAICSGIILYYLNLYLKFNLSKNLISFFSTGLTVLLCSFLYLSAIHYLKVKEITEIKKILLSKLKGAKASSTILTED